MSKGKKPEFGVFALLVIFIYLACIAVDQQKVIDAKSRELEKIEEKIREEASLNEELNKEKEMIQSDEYKEKVAREKLGMIKKNERVYVDIGK